MGRLRSCRVPYTVPLEMSNTIVVHFKMRSTFKSQSQTYYDLMKGGEEIYEKYEERNAQCETIH